MSIIALNINKNIKYMTIQLATEQAWILNLKRASKCIYVIGVVNSSVQGYFRILSSNKSIIQNNRIEFKLTLCNRTEWENINNIIVSRNISLKGFVTKYIP